MTVEDIVINFAEIAGIKCKMLPTDVVIINESKFTYVFRNSVRNNPHIPVDYKDDNIIVIGEYIQPSIKTSFKDLKINWIDGGGNAYIKQDELTVIIEGKPLSRKGPKQSLRGQELLDMIKEDPELIKKTYREISKITDMSLGHVHSILRELKPKCITTK